MVAQSAVRLKLIFRKELICRGFMWKVRVTGAVLFNTYIFVSSNRRLQINKVTLTAIAVSDAANRAMGSTQIRILVPFYRAYVDVNFRPKIGLARKEMGSGQWLVLALGEHSVTLAMFMLEPSVAQATLVRDLHNDFERANRRSLSNGTRSLDRFVFPQRALAERDIGL